MHRSRPIRREHKTLDNKKQANPNNSIPDFENFIAERNFSGALALLEFDIDAVTDQRQKILWEAYCNFHIGNLEQARTAYLDLLSNEDADEPKKKTAVDLACVYYFMQMYSESKDLIKEVSENNPLVHRLLYHIAYKEGNEKETLEHFRHLGKSKEDRLSEASIHFMQRRFQDAIDIYKDLLMTDKNDVALNLYAAMCYFKLDYYDVSLESLAVYQQTCPDSIVATNLKACNNFRLYSGRVALDELRSLDFFDKHLSTNDLLSHNMVVFTNGEKAMQVLPDLIDIIPEARINLIIHFLRTDDVESAFDLAKDIQPKSPQEHIIKGVVSASAGQMKGDLTLVKEAQKHFQAVGTSSSECDTIPGRESMASCLFLLKQFKDANIYLSSIKNYLVNDDNFNWNYGISLAGTGDYVSAEDTLLLIRNKTYKEDLCYNAWLSKCFIMNGKPEKAWQIYNKIESPSESFQLLQLIANDCYRKEQFLFAAKAFHILESVDSDPDFCDGRRGACVGVFKKIIISKQEGTDYSKKKSYDILNEIVNILKESLDDIDDDIVKVILKWSASNGMKLKIDKHAENWN